MMTSKESYSDPESDEDAIDYPDFPKYLLRRCPVHRLTMRVVCVTCRRPLCERGIDDHRNKPGCEIMNPKQDPESYRRMAAVLIEDIRHMLVSGVNVKSFKRLRDVFIRMKAKCEENNDPGDINLTMFNEAIDMVDECRNSEESSAAPDVDTLQFSMDDLQTTHQVDVHNHPETATDSAGISHLHSLPSYMDSDYFNNYSHRRTTTGGFNGDIDDDENGSSDAPDVSFEDASVTMARGHASASPIDVESNGQHHYIHETLHGIIAGERSRRTSGGSRSRRPSGKRRTYAQVVRDGIAQRREIIPSPTDDVSGAAAAARSRYTPYTGIFIDIYSSRLPQAAQQEVGVMGPFSHATISDEYLTFSNGDNTLMWLPQNRSSYTSTGSSVASRSPSRQHHTSGSAASSGIRLCMNEQCYCWYR